MVVISETAVVSVASAILALIGLAQTWSGARQYRYQRGAVRRAEAASGTIKSVGVEHVTTGTATAYVPTVDYEYQTPTQRLRGERIYPGASRYTKLFHSESAAQSVVDDYEPGAPTTVYYDPADSEHSFLKATPHRGPNIARIVLGIGFIGLGAVLVSLSGVV